MEFFYDEVAIKQEEDKSASQEALETKDERTNEAFDKLEGELNNAYSKTAAGLKALVRDRPQVNEEGVQVKLPLGEETAAVAQKYLQSLDSNLENVENIATSYWNKVSRPGFWSSVTETLSSKLDDVVKLTAETVGDAGAPETKSSERAATPIVAGNRTEAELKSLSSDKNIYLEKKKTLEGNDSTEVESQTEEIARLLKGDKELEQLMNQLVPQEISYQMFWSIFFSERTRILDMEEKRKQILANNDTKKTSEQPEQVGWDDDEEDDEEGVEILTQDDETRDESIVIVNKEDAKEESTAKDKSTVEETNGKASKLESSKENNDDDDDDDDDWE